MAAHLALETGQVDFKRGILLRHTGDTASLTPKERALLEYLARRPGRVVSRERLLVDVWGYSPGVVSRAVDKTMSRLRAKVEANSGSPRHLVGVAGEGYRFDPLVEPPPPPRQPRQATVVGRDALIDQLEAAVREGSGAWVLHGPGGVGKTTVARALCDRWDALGIGPASFIDLSACRGGDGVAVALCEALLVDQPAGVVAAVSRVEPALWILDNTEQVDVSVAGWLERLHGATGSGLRIVVTSRQREAVGQHSATTVVSVPPLHGPPARELVVDRARRVVPDFAPTSEDHAVLDTLVERLDGLPLALELAAARLDVCSLADLARRLPESLALKAPDGSSHSRRHASLEAVLAWSWAWLSAEEQAALAACATFSGPFMLEDAEAVVGPAGLLDVLQSLVRASLLHIDRSAGEAAPVRYRLHHTVRAAVVRACPDEVARAQAAHRAWYAQVAPQWNHGIHTHEATAVLARLAGARADLDAALESAIAAGDLHAAVAVSCGLQALLRLRGPHSRWQAVTDAVVRLARGEDGALEARAFLHRGSRLLVMGDPAASASDLLRARRLARAAGAADVACMAAIRLAFLRVLPVEDNGLPTDGSLPTSPFELLEEAHALSEAHDLPRLSALALGERGILRWRHGEHAAAERDFARADRLLARLGDPIQRAGLAYNRLANARAGGRDADALRFATQALARAEAVDFRRVAGLARVQLANLEMVAGNTAVAAGHLHQAAADAHHLGNPELAGLVAMGRAVLALGSGELQAAQAALQDADAQFDLVDTESAAAGWLRAAVAAWVARLQARPDAHLWAKALSVAPEGAVHDAIVAARAGEPVPVPSSHAQRADVQLWAWAVTGASAAPS